MIGCSAHTREPLGRARCRGLRQIDGQPEVRQDLLNHRPVLDRRQHRPRAVAPRPAQPQQRPPLRRQLQRVLRYGWSQHIAVEPFEATPVAGAHGDVGVQVDPSRWAWRGPALLTTGAVASTPSRSTR